MSNHYGEIISHLWDKFGKVGKILTISAGVIAAYSTVQPVIESTLDKAGKIWTTQERIDKLQIEVDTIRSRNIYEKGIRLIARVDSLSKRVKELEEMSEHKQEYIEVLDAIVDGLLITKYHRGVRYGRTKKGDMYYHTMDSDHVRKWMRAIYTAEKDMYGYIDHDGDYHEIIPLTPSYNIK